MPKKITLKQEQDRIRTEFDQLLSTLKPKVPFSTDDVIDLVYHAGERWGDHAHLHFQKELSKKLSRVKDEDQVFAVIGLAFQCWNHFPHKDMGNKAPFELAEMHKQSAAKNQNSQPEVIVGNQKMSMGEYADMLEKMEKTQVPFKNWLFDTVLPTYKKHLEQNYKTKTVEKHYFIAEALCERILHVGFVSPEHVRPEFLYEEFPDWWQTHVMFKDYKEQTVANSVMNFITFIAETTGVLVGGEYMLSDPDFWS